MKKKLLNSSLILILAIFGLNNSVNAQQLVKDIIPDGVFSFPTDLVNVNGILFFTVNDGINGTELWKSDGTETGTIMVKDIVAGKTSSNPLFLTDVNGTLFFVATTATNGDELWKSDGTEAGTVMVKDINLRVKDGTSNYGSSPYNLYNMNGVLYFAANNYTNGQELWKSDGTQQGTIMVKDIAANSSNSSPNDLININGVLYFSANDGSGINPGGIELWKSDGTSAGTVMVKDICNTTTRPWASICPFRKVNNELYFVPIYKGDNTLGTELWKSDGTNAGTVLIANIRVHTSSLENAIVFNGSLYFVAFDEVNGDELWKSDGTLTGTVILKDINTGTANAQISQIISYNGSLFFAANNGTNGIELWKSDGSASGTFMLKDIFLGVGNSQPSLFLNYNNSLYFAATDQTNGYKKWKTDGTVSGTVLHPNDDLKYGLNVEWPSGYSTKHINAVVNNTLFFQSSHGTFGGELWKYDGKTTGLENKNSEEFNFTIYPNPTSGIITISASHVIENINIFDVT